MSAGTLKQGTATVLLKSQASVQLVGGVPFLPDADLWAALQNAGASAEARLAGLRSALAVLALIALLGLFSARRIPPRQPPSLPA